MCAECVQNVHLRTDVNEVSCSLGANVLLCVFFTRTQSIPTPDTGGQKNCLLEAHYLRILKTERTNDGRRHHLATQHHHTNSLLPRTHARVGFQKDDKGTTRSLIGSVAFRVTPFVKSRDARNALRITVHTRSLRV
jgi:hypothetical protein